MPLKHVPPTEQHTPGSHLPISVLSKPMPKGAGPSDLMGDLNAALLKRKTGKTRGGGMKMGNTMARLAGCSMNMPQMAKKESRKAETKRADEDEATDF